MRNLGGLPKYNFDQDQSQDLPRKQSGKVNWGQAYMNQKKPLQEKEWGYGRTQDLSRERGPSQHGTMRYLGPEGGTTIAHDYGNVGALDDLPGGLDPTILSKYKPLSGDYDFNFEPKERFGDYDRPAIEKPPTIAELMSPVGDLMRGSEAGFNPRAYMLMNAAMAPVAREGWTRYLSDSGISERDSSRRLERDRAAVEGERLDLAEALAPSQHRSAMVQSDAALHGLNLSNMMLTGTPEERASAERARFGYSGTKEAATDKNVTAKRAALRSRIQPLQNQLNSAYMSNDPVAIEKAMNQWESFMSTLPPEQREEARQGVVEYESVSRHGKGALGAVAPWFDLAFDPKYSLNPFEWKGNYDQAVRENSELRPKKQTALPYR